MPRPNLISEIHGFKYDLRRGSLKDRELIKLQNDYDAAVEKACEEFRCTKVELLKVIAGDFGKWIAEQKLPPIAKSNQ